jgi:hypothetical protein
VIVKIITTYVLNSKRQSSNTSNFIFIEASRQLQGHTLHPRDVVLRTVPPERNPSTGSSRRESGPPTGNLHRHHRKGKGGSGGVADVIAFKAVRWEQVGGSELATTDIGGMGMSANGAGKTLTGGSHNLFSISNDFQCPNFKIQNDALSGLQNS